MSLGIGGCVHFKRTQWVCLWNKRRKRTLQVINPFNSPARAPHATADNTAVPQNRLRRERMLVDCFTGVALWNIYINDKRTILLKHEAHWESPFSPSLSLCLLCEADLVMWQQLQVYVLYREYGRTSGRAMVNESMLISTQHKYCIVFWEVDFLVFQAYCNQAF